MMLPPQAPWLMASAPEPRCVVSVSKNIPAVAGVTLSGLELKIPDFGTPATPDTLCFLWTFVDDERGEEEMWCTARELPRLVRLLTRPIDDATDEAPIVIDLGTDLLPSPVFVAFAKDVDRRLRLPPVVLHACGAALQIILRKAEALGLIPPGSGGAS